MTQTPTAPIAAGPAGKPTFPPNPSTGFTAPTTEQVDAAVLRPEAGNPPGATSSIRGRLAAYVALTKPRIIELLLVTTLPAMVLAAKGLPGLGVVLATLVGGTLAAGSANALNCYVDRDIDAVMHRTGRRPLARNTVTPRAALIFGVVLGVVAVSVMATATNLFAAALTFLAIAFYVVIYTMILKRRTPQNIVWGGAAGCMPVLIGWVAVTDRLAWAPVVLFLIVFFWTPPHFWALAIRYREDYDRAGVPMLPVVATPVAVARQIVAYTWLTVGVSLVLWPLATSWIYGVLAVAGGAAMIVESHRLLIATRSDRTPRPMRLFHLSNSYLALLFVAVAVDAFLR